MKNLIFINGTMGVGKTTTSQELKKLLPKCVFLDGDWCWDMLPFVVTGETKEMVLDNISHLLNNFLNCTEYENIIFCWVMHEESIIEDVIERLKNTSYKLYKFSLVCTDVALKQRLEKDIKAMIRQPDLIERSIPRLKNYYKMDTVKIDVGDISAKQAAKQIYNMIMTKDDNQYGI